MKTKDCRRRRASCAPTGIRRDAHPAPADSAEMLVGYGFRGWIAGYQTGDVGCWERVWRLYSNLITPKRAATVVGSLAEWAKCVNASAQRRVEVNPLDDCTFCRDECLAVSMIAACQHNTCPAMRACAFALIDNSLVDEVLYHAGTFAITMRSIDRIVSPAWIVNASALVDPVATARH
ncbi:MAG: hypothetical protein AB1749_10985 [Pseudomonadota bacterium]